MFEHIDYDETSPTCLRFNRDWGAKIKKGQVAGSIKPDRIELTVMRKAYSGARVVWMKHYGEIPAKMVVVCLDGNPHNLTISNLHLMTWQQQRMFNSIARGVGQGNFRINKNGTVRSYFMERKEGYHNKEALGTFDSMDEAMERLRRRQLQVFLKEDTDEDIYSSEPEVKGLHIL